MKKILLIAIGILFLANIIQFCASKSTSAQLEFRNSQVDCMQKCMK